MCFQPHLSGETFIFVPSPLEGEELLVWLQLVLAEESGVVPSELELRHHHSLKADA